VTPRVPEQYEALTTRLSTGVRGLDKLMGGGPFAGSTTLVVGSTGSGKTTLALQFALEGVEQGEKVLYINFQENPAQLRKAIANLGRDPDAAEQRGLVLLYASPVELQIDSIVQEIFDAIEDKGVRRLVIDALGDLSIAASDPQRLHDYLYALIQHFSVRGATTLMTLESSEGFTATSKFLDQRYSYMSDNLIHLGDGIQPAKRRDLRIVKMRGSAHQRAPREFEITRKGLRIK
jgi:circadian clock protein KaiC